jgi:hypothetical protein
VRWSPEDEDGRLSHRLAGWESRDDYGHPIWPPGTSNGGHAMFTDFHNARSRKLLSQGKRVWA